MTYYINVVQDTTFYLLDKVPHKFDFTNTNIYTPAQIHLANSGQ